MGLIRFGDYRLDRAQGLWREDKEIRLTPKSLSVLCVLAERAGQVISKDELFQTVWPDVSVTDSALTSCVQELRHALGDDARKPRYIETLPRRGYRFREQISRDVRAASVPAAASAPPDSPIVGRRNAIEELLAAAALAAQGRRQVVFITGEAGIGKTTVLRAFCDRLAEAGPVRTTWGQCVQHYGVGEPYQPLLEALARLCRRPDADEVMPLVERYCPTWLAQVPALVPSERLEHLRRSAAGTTRDRMLRELIDAMEAITARERLVLWLEDLHWSDLSTLDWIAAFAQRPEPARLLLIGTFRPFLASGPEHPLASVSDDLRMKGFCREIMLRGLDEASVADYVALSCPPASGQGERLRRMARRIHQHTGGNPLFVGNVIGDLIARGLLVRDGDRWNLTADVNRTELGIPDDIRRMIGRQIDRLPPEEREVLEIASVAGASCATAAIAAAAGRQLEEIESTLMTLARHNQFVRDAGTVEWPDGTISARFDFLHVLYRDVLYQRVPPARRAQLHRQVGTRTELAYGKKAPEIAAELAMHFERSGELSRVAAYLQQAAGNARARGAYGEARIHFERALALLAGEPPGAERSARELELQIGRGAVIMAARGWSAPEAAEAYSRARTLSQELGDTPRLFSALWGLWLFYWGRGPLSTAQELVQDLLDLARRHGNEAARLEAYHAAWATAFGRGDLLASCGHAAGGMSVYEPDQHASLAATYGSHDAGTCCRNFLGWALALRGRSDEARRSSRDAIDLARRLGHPFSLALTHFFAAATAQTLRDRAALQANAAAAVTVAREQDFRLVLGWALTLDGWAAVEDGRFEEGMDYLANGLAEVRATGSFQFLPYLISLKAQAHLTHGEAASGLQALDEAFSVTRMTGESFWNAELHRLKGELQLAADVPSADLEAQENFGHAIDIARSQDARLLMLRASVSLGRLLRRMKRDTEARQLVSDAYAGVANGVGLTDSIEVREFLGAETE
jgi:DNA-binding winged helix-turn-helix (wHTH) protein/predicted ATPase